LLLEIKEHYKRQVELQLLLVMDISIIHLLLDLLHSKSLRQVQDLSKLWFLVAAVVVVDLPVLELSVVEEQVVQVLFIIQIHLEYL
jgi:hypothetical protein